MQRAGIFKALLFFFTVGLIALLYRLTLDDAAVDPCANPQGDVSGAVLSDVEDQDALVNRAIIIQGGCEQKPGD